MFQDVCERAGLGRDWAPRDLRHTFVSLLSDDGMAIEKIARLAGHASSHVTETVYRQELRPVLQEGAEVMDRPFGAVGSGLAEKRRGTSETEPIHPWHGPPVGRRPDLPMTGAARHLSLRGWDDLAHDAAGRLAPAG